MRPLRRTPKEQEEARVDDRKVEELERRVTRVEAQVRALKASRAQQSGERTC